MLSMGKAKEEGFRFVTELSQLSVPPSDGTLVIFPASCPAIKKKLTGHRASTQPSSFEKEFPCHANAAWESIVVLGADCWVFFALVKICSSGVPGPCIG